MVDGLTWLFYLPLTAGFQAQMAIFFGLGIVFGWVMAARLYRRRRSYLRVDVMPDFSKMKVEYDARIQS